MLPHPVVAMLQERDNAYHRLLLLVGPPSSGKIRTLRRWQPLLAAPYVNLSLSARLLDVALRRTPTHPLLDEFLQHYHDQLKRGLACDFLGRVLAGVTSRP